MASRVESNSSSNMGNNAREYRPPRSNNNNKNHGPGALREPPLPPPATGGGDQSGLAAGNMFARLNLENIFDKSEMNYLSFLIVVRTISFIAWTGSIIFATYHVFLACEEFLTWHRDPIMNPGSFSSLLNRGKDSTDSEWEMFVHLYVTRLWFWYGLHAIMSRVVQTTIPHMWGCISTGFSFIMHWELIGFLPTVFIVFQPIIYWVLAQTRSKSLLWGVTVIFIYNLNTPFVQWFIPDGNLSEYVFVITAAWNYARCISFCCDSWDKVGSNYLGIDYLEKGVRYCLYLPLAISGPLVTFESFERNVINCDTEALKRRNMVQDFLNLIKTLSRIVAVALLSELILHFLYFRSLSLTTVAHPYTSLWAICGTVYWLGNFFAMKYKVLYGIPTCIAEFDGMEMPPLPRCPSYLHRYSVLWRDFDRGLYRFLINYIYLPTLNGIKGLDTTNIIPHDVQKLMASFMSFVYVYIWHSLSFDVFVWAALNFIGITIERIGSVAKREMDKRGTFEPLFWDFLIEPIVTVPLAAMSILNSSIFCGSMEAAASFSIQLWKRKQDNWVWIALILFCFTHTAVTYRTWRNKLYRLFMKTKSQ